MDHAGGLTHLIIAVIRHMRSVNNQDLAAAGFALLELMTARRWKSPRMPARYTERQAAGRGAVARYYPRGPWCKEALSQRPRAHPDLEIDLWGEESLPVADRQVVVYQVCLLRFTYPLVSRAQMCMDGCHPIANSTRVLVVTRQVRQSVLQATRLPDIERDPPVQRPLREDVIPRLVWPAKIGGREPRSRKTYLTTRASLLGW